MCVVFLVYLAVVSVWRFGALGGWLVASLRGREAGAFVFAIL